MESQIIFPAVLITLTAMLVILGIQIFYILKEFRETVKKINTVLDDTKTISQSFSQPVSWVSGLVMGLKSTNLLANIFKGGKNVRQS